MNLNIKRIVFLVCASSLTGLLINSLSPKGIPLIKEKPEITFANDSILFNNNQDSSEVSKKSENNNRISKTEPGNEVFEPGKNEIKKPLAVNISQAYKLYQNDVLFIDAREAEDFEAGHIKGAVNMPFYSDDYYSLLKDIKKDKPLVVYCGGTECDLSHLLANELSELGYKNVYVFFGGWVDWLENDYPVSKIK